MATPERPRCLFGIETEYGFAVLGPGATRLEPEQGASDLLREVRARVPHLLCSGTHDFFTANGSRIYVDCGVHPEVATPECTTPEELVGFSRAGDRLLAEAARAVEGARKDEGVEIVLWKANVDHRTGATYGSHESYLHRRPQDAFSEALIPHLVTRTVYTGAGGFRTGAKALELVVSPRAFHLVRPVSSESTHTRGIFHTRDEGLAGNGFRRLHVLAGESLWSQTAEYLRVGTTALLVAMIDAGRNPAAGLTLTAPLEALHAVAGDLACRATMRLRPMRRMTAVEIQRRLLEQVEGALGADVLPPWAGTVCRRWRAVLDALEAAPESLAGVLDWPTKLAVLARQPEARTSSWAVGRARAAATPRSHPHGSPESNPECHPEEGIRHRTGTAGDIHPDQRLLEMDMRFCRLDAGGIFHALDRADAFPHRVVSPEAVEHAVGEPPVAGRARVRGINVARLGHEGANARCTWQRIFDYDQGRVLALDDPLVSEVPTWQPVPVETGVRRRVRRGS